MSNTGALEGGCLCGAVRYRVELPVKWCAHCHCRVCRKAHGAGFVTWFGVDRPAFHLHRGEDALRWRASSPEAERAFCSECGTPLFFRSERWPGEIHVAVGTVDEPAALLPAVNVFTDDAIPWNYSLHTLPTLGGPSGIEPVSKPQS